MNLISFVLFLCFLAHPIFSSLPKDQNICRGLAFQGGPDKGAYQAGALAGLIANLPSDETSYDVVSGVSIGAVNAAWMSQFPKGQEEQLSDELINFWLEVKSSDIYKNWKGGFVQGALFEPSLYDTEPGQEYLKKIITKHPSRYIAVGATNMNTGMYKSFNNFKRLLKKEDLLDAVMASVAIPGLFPHMVIKDTPYFDGSVVRSLDIASIVQKCRNITGGDDSKIIIDIILGSDKHFAEVNMSDYNSLKILMKTMELMSYEKGCIGLIRAQQIYPEVNFRYIVRPSQAFNQSDLPLHFNHKELVKMIELGKTDAENAVKKGDKVNLDEFLEAAQKQFGSYFETHFGTRMMKKYVHKVNQAAFKKEEALLSQSAGIIDT